MDSEHYLVGRLGTDGSILTSTQLDGFWIRSSVDGVFHIVELQIDGSKIVENRLIAAHLPTSVAIKLSLFSSGTTFDDGTVAREITLGDLSDEGEYIYRMILPANDNVPCHTTKAFQETILVGQK